jgi:hypothetical protein
MPEVKCNYIFNYCKFLQPCSEFPDEYKLYNLDLEIIDASQPGTHWSMFINIKSLLIPGDQIGDTANICYVGIFRSYDYS